MLQLGRIGRDLVIPHEKNGLSEKPLHMVNQVAPKEKVEDTVIPHILHHLGLRALTLQVPRLQMRGIMTIGIKVVGIHVTVIGNKEWLDTSVIYLLLEPKGLILPRVYVCIICVLQHKTVIVNILICPHEGDACFK